MLQQTQVKTVIPFWIRWLRELPTLQAVAGASPDQLHKLWEGLGYYTRVRNLQRAAHVIVQDHTGIFPRNFDAVLALPGIGRYTAGAICSIAFNQPKPLLDGNVIRLLTRLFGIAENPRDKAVNDRLWQLAENLVVHAQTHRPALVLGNCSALNQSLMEVGALVCLPRNPECLLCPVRNHCVAFRKNRIAELPNLAPRPAATARRFTTFVVERRGKFLVRQRPAGVVNARLWEFPNIETTGQKLAPKEIFRAEFGVPPAELTPLLTLRHSITRYRITLDAFTACAPRLSIRGAVWQTPAQMHRLAFTSAHRRILHAIAPPHSAPGFPNP